ncbi:glycosyltransferase family 4 protein, partial [Phocaeicola vulgatus]
QYHGINNINFLGFVTHDILAQKYQDADLFVFPTLGEGYGMVVLEALSTGTPVLISNLAGGDDAIENYKNGLVYEATSEASLKSALDWFIEHRDMIPQMSKEAYETAQKLTWEKYHKLYAENILNILNK